MAMNCGRKIPTAAEIKPKVIARLKAQQAKVKAHKTVTESKAMDVVKK